ncbi:MAG: adenylate/guanylate cyclase domain-containing protein [Marinifilaceae bacterium]
MKYFKSLLPKPLRNIFVMILIWLLAAFLFAHFQLMDLEDLQDPLSRLISDPFSRKIKGLNIFLTGILFGTIFGLLDNYSQSKYDRLKKKSYGQIILFYSILHVILIFISIILVFIFSQYLMHGHITSEGEKIFREFFHSKNTISILVYTYIISSLIVFIKQVNKKFGPGILKNMILGKYRQPKEENCIFMFMDLKSSTTYAEKLGHHKYSQLIQDCFSDLTDAVNRFEAKIYQYVGDEVVLCWEYDKGIQNANCVKLYYDFKRILQKRSAHYQEQYGLVPQFKAGINGGLIMIAEVGIIKRSIAYHGDVINTASRIQGQCNDFNQEMLLSETIAEAIASTDTIKCNPIGGVLLKGKSKKVNIYSINEDSIPGNN